MAYAITERCVGTKDHSCVDVCPVDCIHPTADEPAFEDVEQLYINPDDCIDCDACVDACPVDAPFPLEDLPEEFAGSAAANAGYFNGSD